MSDMTARERIAAAIALEPVDRVPVIPKTEVFAMRYSGLPVSTEIKDGDRFRWALDNLYEGLGGYDAITMPGQFMNELGFYPMGSASKLPGYQLPDDDLWQMDEREAMSVEDYDLIKEKGWAGYLPYVYPKLGYPVAPEDVPARQQDLVDRRFKDMRFWEAKGVPVLLGPGYIA